MGWYTLIQKQLNVGLSYSLTIPFGSGKNVNQKFADGGGNLSSILSREDFALTEETPRATKLSGYDISITLFADNDFYFHSNQLNDQISKVVAHTGLTQGLFRITPTITYRNLKDELFYNEEQNFVGRHEYFSLGLNFKVQLILGKEKNIFFYLGWLPNIVFIQNYHTTTNAQHRRDSDAGNPVEINRKQNLESPFIQYSDFGIGFSYLFFKKLKLNIAFYPTDSGNQIDLTRLDLGIDYTF